MKKRSKNSCFNIISCGRKSFPDDDFEESYNQKKHSTDKRKWSFRKRSSRHQVLNNDVITENPLPGTTVNAESTSFKYHPETDHVLPEKLSVLQWPDEIPTVKQDEVILEKQNEVPSKNQDEQINGNQNVVPTKNQDEVTTHEQGEVTTKEEDETPIRKEDEVTNNGEKYEAPIRIEDEVKNNEEKDVVTIKKEDEEVIAKEEKDAGIRNEGELPSKEDQVIIVKEDEVAPPLAAANQIPDPVIAQENDIETEPIACTGNASQVDSLTTLENGSTVDLYVEESIVTLLQAAIRGYLAKRALLKHRSVIKLQAAVRGHLVRGLAVGTLRCVQAIVKMQALVRARRARSLEGSGIEEKLGGKEKNHQGPLVNSSSVVAGKTNTHYSSTQKLLSNGFARQLLESAPKKKKIHVKCDPSIADSSWKWLDRWASVSSSKFTQPKRSESNPVLLDHGERIKDVSCGVETGIPADLSSNIRDTKMLDDSEENSITHHADNFDFHGSHLSASPGSGNVEQPWLVDDAGRKEQEHYAKVDMNQPEKQLDTGSLTVLDSTLNDPREENEQIKHSSVNTAAEEPGTEGKKSSLVSRMAANPALLAAHSKFGDPSLRTISGRPISSTYQDDGLEPKSNKLSSPADFEAMDKDHNSIAENPISNDIISECGTELSTSSTLDSPNRSEVGGEEFETEATVVSDINGGTDNASNLGNVGANEAKVGEPVVSDVNGCMDDAEEVVSDMSVCTDDAEKVVSDMNDSIDNASCFENQVVDAGNDSTMLEPMSPHPVSVLPEKVDDVARESTDSFVLEETPYKERQQERASSDVQNIEMDTRTDFEAPRSSVEGSPVINITAPESQETPSSQVSVKAKLKKKLGKSVSSQIRNSPSASKKPPVQPTPDSGARNSTEQLPKEPKIAKRRFSFGSAKPEHVELELKDSSSISLPSPAASKKPPVQATPDSGTRSSTEQLPKEPKIVKRRFSLGSAKPDHLELELKDSSRISLPSSSASKKPPVQTTSDSGARTSTGQLPKEPKIVTRRFSFGSARPEHVELEPRDNSSISLLRQATKSAPSESKKPPVQTTPDSTARSSTEQLPNEPKIVKRRFSFGSAKPDHVELEPKDSSSISLPSPSASKKPPVQTTPDSGPRSSTEQLPKEPKIVKRRFSFGSAKPDHVELEPKDSSSISLPSPSASKKPPVQTTPDSGPRSSTEQLPKEPKIVKRRFSFGSAKPEHVDLEPKDSSSISHPSPSASKKPPVQTTPDSGARISTEQLPKEPKIVKRRFSFGSAKPEHVDLEPKDSSTISLPSPYASKKPPVQTTPDSGVRSNTEQLPKEPKIVKRRFSFGSKPDHVELEPKDSSTISLPSPSASKKPPVQTTPDSGARSNTEQLPKGPKIVKRRFSFGSAKPEHVELQPKDSSSISVPSYMQATQSAKLKANSINSPKPKTEVEEKDTISIKKLHSLSGATTKHGSPHVQQPESQKQQPAPTAKHTHTPREEEDCKAP